jgi:23S rRNA (uracil1939-C5)-methyltransferase
VPQLQEQLEELRQQMVEDSLPDGARHFRAIAGDEGTAVSTDLRSPSVSQGSIRRTIHGETYGLNADSFFQTNVDLLGQLIDTTIGEASGDTAVELYCGVGLFTLPLARRFKQVIGVEENDAAVNFGRLNLANASLTNARIENSGVAQWFETVLEGGGRVQPRREHRARSFNRHRPVDRFNGEHQIQSAVTAGALQIDLLLLDPPRVGAESRVVDGILQLLPKRICYVSCDPATLARDLRKIIAGGYSLDSLAAFDMFPQTHHVETIANLTAP